MPLTLSQAKSRLNTFIDNGVCSSDERVVLKINEAQRRLHAYRAWLGVLARFYITPTNNIFNLPAPTGNLSSFSGFGLESALMVSQTEVTGAQPVVDVRSFVSPAGDLLDIVPADATNSTRSYRIVGETVGKIEVTGKLNFVEAASDTDLLVIEDTEALKLMLLAIYREENDQLESAQALEQKAVERLTLKTDRAVEAARRINFQTRLGVEVENSFGQMLSRLALDIEDGLRIFDSELADILNQAEEALFNLGSWSGTVEQYKVTVDNAGEVYLPNNIGAILAVAIEGRPVPVRDRMFDFHENGPGYQEKGSSGYEFLVDRGEKFVSGKWMRRYFVRSHASTGECVEVLAKKRWTRKRKNSDKMDIRNYPALREMVISLRTKDDLEKSTVREQRSLNYLQKELKELRGGAKGTIQIQAKAFSPGEITALV
ncbi:MAG: hypothetical protein EBU96_04200 [Actinobacteria bacterium]|nr:hypothetical protein [Actinomycetota bacterium]